MNWFAETDPDVLSEAALAKAQALMSHAMRTSQMDEAQLAVKMGKTPSSLQFMLSSGCNLTVRTLGELLGICGYRLKIELQKLPARAAATETDEARASAIPESREYDLKIELQKLPATAAATEPGRSSCQRDPGVTGIRPSTVRALEGRSSAHACSVSSRALFGMP